MSEKEELVGTITKLAVINMVAVTVVGVGTYLIRCDIHLLTPLLPICLKKPNADGIIDYDHRSYPYNTLYAALQLFLEMQVNCASFPYIALMLTLVHDGVEITRALNLK